MKIDVTKMTLTQILKLHGFGWDILEKNKVISNRTYYRMIKGETTPQKGTVKKIADFLKVSEKQFLIILDNEIKSRKK